MCAIFGLLDYRGKGTAAQRLQIVRALGTAAEVRGTDATGIAFFQRKKLCIQKAAKPAHRMRYHIPGEVRYIMGHTRMTTQGSAKKNQNNHPFAGKAGNTQFALAHNGVLSNDRELRYSNGLPATDIETDSYVAVQLIEKQKEVSPGSLRRMAEAVRGHFTFTVLDEDNNLYFVKGENPLTIFHYPQQGFYLYASTESILLEVLVTLGIEYIQWEMIQPVEGEILQIDRHGRRESASFSVSGMGWGWQADYIRKLKQATAFYGYDSSLVDYLLYEGCSTDEIEDFIYCREGVWE